MTIKRATGREAAAALPKRPPIDSQLKTVEKKMSQGPLIGRMAYLSGLAETLFDARYEKAAKKMAPAGGGWSAQAPTDPVALKKAAVGAAIETGIGDSMLRVQVSHTGERAKIFVTTWADPMNYPSSTREVTAKTAPKDPRFGQLLTELARTLASELIKLDPKTKL